MNIDSVQEYDITQSPLEKEIQIPADEFLLVGIPVYAGRIPKIAADSLQLLKGAHSPAIIVCVYGNRDYDDALLELKDMVERNGFNVISGGAFIAQHSIFPEVGQGRPDDADKKIITDFAHKSAELLTNYEPTKMLSELKIKGNHPYKEPKGIPLQPKGNNQCDKCGTCVRLCPTAAIPEDKPRKTDKEKCISCGRCIVVCPRKARHFGGILYKIAGKKFLKSYSARKDSEVFYADII
jgi:ferredoxin